MTSNGIILLSSGLDSATAMWKVKDNYKDIYTLTFAYGSRDEDVALSCAEKLSTLAGAKHHVISLPWLQDFSSRSGSTLISTSGDLPTPTEDELDKASAASESAKSVWIPARNLVFLSVAASFAESIGGGEIITGFNREEAATFPDNTASFVSAMNSVLEYAVLEKNVSVVAPLRRMDKSEIAGLAVDLGAPVEYMSSCYMPQGLDRERRPVHCGRCESCRRRMRAFKAAGVSDKTIYEP
ncbi:MAG TPA: 7-cyano-7-deazaguanine synthase QueC [Euryarchaeota archaeon]|nr:7-cyano-7-deazaguanine synthase [archaeon BMS3Abin16]HDH27809.1 7-cyano-7-deazaguanine synthase QueC [Euryarchaeota archaeon]HDY73842.1 7-cyano-7-deazaguanine synthase QueC [Euryarchaeota archaeon]